MSVFLSLPPPYYPTNVGQRMRRVSFFFLDPPVSWCASYFSFMSMFGCGLVSFLNVHLFPFCIAPLKGGLLPTVKELLLLTSCSCQVFWSVFSSSIRGRKRQESKASWHSLCAFFPWWLQVWTLVGATEVGHGFIGEGGVLSLLRGCATCWETV